MKGEGGENTGIGFESKFREGETEFQKVLLDVARSAYYPVEIRKIAMAMRNTIDALSKNTIPLDEAVERLHTQISDCQRLLLAEQRSKLEISTHFSVFLESIQEKIRAGNYDFLG
ncbi:MAG TPA: hypothetical protein PK295_03505 [Candidatus Magasanikbacteria bacterium]|nr:hypothetical protein [Candidatus Magasanikbacteria bacterium]